MKLNSSILCLLAAFALTSVRAVASPENFDATTEAVGRVTNGIETPVNQLVTPAGTVVELAGMRPQALALSPDGKLLVTAGLTQELVVLDPASRKILQRVPLPADQTPAQAPNTAEVLSPPQKSQLSFTGLAFSPDGSRIYMANVNGDIKVFEVQADRTVVPLFSIPLPPANARSAHGGNSRRHCRFAGRQKNLRCVQSFQSPGRTGRRHRAHAPELGRGSCAL